MSLTKLSLAGKNLIILGQGELISDILAGDRKTAKPFFTVYPLFFSRYSHSAFLCVFNYGLCPRMRPYNIKRMGSSRPWLLERVRWVASQ
jgi:hypothetical protein